MKHRWHILFLPILVFLATFTALQFSVAASPSNTNNKTVQSVHDQRYIVRFVGDVNLQADSRANLIDALKMQHALQMADVAPLLSETEFKPLWIINAVALTGSAQLLEQLANHRAVASIEVDGTVDAPVNPLCKTHLSPQLAPLDANCPNLFTEQITTTAHSTTAHKRSDSQLRTAWGVPHIRAPHAWHALGIDGTGSVVAIVDTGVDWTHPVLQANYRGDVNNHTAHWFDASTAASPVPTDTFGHGTHVAGSAVGQEGYGVAPNAKWIGVNIFEEDGFAYESAILAGFQWLLAPNGDASLAPDVVNNSWGGGSPSQAIKDGFAALHAAGIMTVNSAGNNGRVENAVALPAALDDVLAVGATDHREMAAWFSSRGPSVLSEQIKPTLSAPGVQILSSYPSGRYAIMSGTSMAAPHVAGLVALLRQVDGGLDHTALTNILTTTATMGTNTPNFDLGWGIVDAYRAVAQTLNIASVRLQFAGLADLRVTIETDNGAAFSFLTDESGEVEVWLRGGVYAVSADSPLHTLPETSLQIDNSTPEVIPFEPERRPFTTLSGRVTDVNGQPITATVAVIETSFTIQTDATGAYQLEVPLGGDVEIVATGEGYSTVRRVIGVADRPMIAHFQLAPQTKTLLVNADAWRYDDVTAGFYEQALRDLGRSYDVYDMYDPLIDVPASADVLAQYDHVIWSHPTTAPSFIGSQTIISDYLGTGGDFLLSGHSVARIEDDTLFSGIYWYWLFGATHIDSITPDTTFQGINAPFSDLRLSFNGNDSNRDQSEIDLLGIRHGSLTQPILQTESGQIVGLQATRCQPFNALLFGFGVQGVSGRANRAKLLASSFDAFDLPANEQGLLFPTKTVDDFVHPNEQFVYTVTVRNMSEVTTETVQLRLDSTWETTILTPTLTLGPCQSGSVVVTVRAPAQLGNAGAYSSRLIAETERSSAEFPLTHRVSRDILLVDDDRWYDNEHVYIETLTTMGVPFDYWETGWRQEEGRGEISADRLAQYDIVLWFTGADWFAPVTRNEADVLQQFVTDGGRLLLTSQDYLYYSSEHPLTDNLGVLKHVETVTPTLAFGQPSSRLPSNFARSQRFNYTNYNPWGDGLIPQADSAPVLWHDSGMIGGLATARDDWRTVFWSVPLEILENPKPILADTVGWLSDLGDTTFSVDQPNAGFNESRLFTLKLKNLPSAPSNFATITNTLSADLILDPTSLQGAIYNSAQRTIHWSGNLSSGAEHEISYRAAPAKPTVENRVQIHYERHNLTFEKAVTIWTNAPDLTLSSLHFDNRTVTLQLENHGASGAVSADLYFPPNHQLLTPTLKTSVGTPTVAPNHVSWQGEIVNGGIVTITGNITAQVSAENQYLSVVAYIDDGVTTPFVRDQISILYPPYRVYLPIVSHTD